MTFHAIGVFDSGNGGKFVVEKLQELLPHHRYKRVADADHAPYGERRYKEITQLTDTAIQPLLSDCPIIVLACNTATAAAIEYLQKKYPATIFVGFEPMIKRAAKYSKLRHITLLATRATQQAPRTQQLIAAYAKDCAIDYIDTAGWAKKIDDGCADDIELSSLEQSLKNGSDSVIIGCTHYIALTNRIQQLAPNAALYEPTEEVAYEIMHQVNKLLQ